MKDQFPGFYAPTAVEYEALIKTGLIVLDANVLLRLYQFPEHSRKQALDVLEKVRDRIWISNYAALEYQLNRINVIAAGVRQVSSAEEKVRAAVKSVVQVVDDLELDKRGLTADPARLNAEMLALGERINEVIGRAAKGQQMISTEDPIRDQLDRILADRVGVPPQDQAALSALVGDGEQRYQDRVPPGYMDADKEKNPARASFKYDGLRYERKFGDLLIWKQLIEHAKKNRLKKVLLVTSDLKEDWWWVEQGKTLGPRPELTAEIRREAEVESFWAYNFVQFLENARQYLAVDVSAQSMEEIKQASQQPVVQVFEIPKRIAQGFTAHSPSARRMARTALWFRLEKSGRKVEFRIDEFPSYLVHAEVEGQPPKGYDIATFNRISDEVFFRRLEDFVRASIAISVGELSSFELVVVISEKEAKRKDFNELLASMQRYLEQFRGCSITFCTLEGTELTDVATVGADLED